MPVHETYLDAGSRDPRPDCRHSAEPQTQVIEAFEPQISSPPRNLIECHSMAEGVPVTARLQPVIWSWHPPFDVCFNSYHCVPERLPRLCLIAEALNRARRLSHGYNAALSNRCCPPDRRESRHMPCRDPPFFAISNDMLIPCEPLANCAPNTGTPTEARGYLIGKE